MAIRIFGAMLAIVALTGWAQSATSGSAPRATYETAMQLFDRCSGVSPNAAVESCLVRGTNRYFASLRHEVCTSGGCVVALHCATQGVCEANGYKLAYVPSDDGTGLTITDPAGAESKYDQCGTCWTDVDYVSGPMKNVTFLTGSKIVLLAIKK